jgi:hypothetical protein
MADIDRLTTNVATVIQATLGRVGSLIRGVAVLALLVGIATFATGWWVFDHSSTWVVIGGLLCTIPPLAALVGWMRVARTARLAPQLVSDVRSLLQTTRNSAAKLIDHDTGESLVVTSRSYQALRLELQERRGDLPALFSGVRAIATVPGLAAIAVAGIVVIGGLGTILLIAGVIG